MARRQISTIQFTTVHLAILGTGVLCASAVVFLLGIYVGRGLPIHHAGVDERVARIPVGEPPRMVEVERAPPAASTGLAAAPAAVAAAEPPNVIGEAIAAAREAEGPAAHAGQVEPRPGRPAPEPLEAPEPRPSTKPSVPYTVQVLATRNRDEAMTLADGLKRQRIGAFVSQVEDAGGSWYRVRIGIYDDLESAQVMETRLRKLGLQQAYVSRYR